VITGHVTARYRKREREYVDVEAVVHSAERPDDPIWTSTVTFTPAAAWQAQPTEGEATP
jgi:hypothetical protein